MSAKTVFISYRRIDSAYAVDQLDDRLKQAFGTNAVFRDVRSIEAGIAFPDDIRTALSEAQVGLVVIGPWWLAVASDPNNPKSPRRLDDPTDVVRLEIETLLGRGGVSVIPLLLGGASMPKTDDLPSSLRELPDRNGMVLRPYPDFEHSVGLVIASVARILNVNPAPFGVSANDGKGDSTRVSPTRLTVTGRKFVGRDHELYLLDEAWGRSAGDKINIVSFIGQGGEGKTALVLEWYSRRARRGWQGARRVFDWSFYSQGTSAQTSASADDFFNAAFEWFGHTGEIPKVAWNKGGKLAELIAAERTLLVLDGLEPLQQPPGGYGGEFKDPAVKALLRGLAMHNPGLCILTSRTDITDLAGFEHAEGSCLRHSLHSLDATAARMLLRELGVLGPDKELDEAIEWFHRHAYDLNLLGNFLAKCTPDRDIHGWQQKFPLLQEDERIHPIPDAAGKRVGHGRRMLRAYERWLGPKSPATALLRLLGLFDRPVRSDLLDELRAAPAITSLTDTLVPLTDEDWLGTLDELEQLALISRERLSLSAESAGSNEGQKAKRPRRSVSYALDTHPLLREHFATELRERQPEAWRAGNRRLYEYLCATTPDHSRPTLEDLQPLYQAVAHGCKADLQQEACDQVYYDRIQRGAEAYSTRKLGAVGSDLGAIACFFGVPWSRVSTALDEATRSWLLGEAAYTLRALGRPTEALEPMRAGMNMDIKGEDWRNAAIAARELSMLDSLLGDVSASLHDAEQSVVYADRSGHAFERMGERSVYADSLHQTGRRAEAEVRFREAEKMQAELQPAYPLLYSLQGFQYCDLLLTEAERAAWHTILQLEKRNSEVETAAAACRTVTERATETLTWAKQYLGLLDIALGHLTLGRAALYAVVLEDSNGVTPVDHDGNIDAAVATFRRAGQQQYLPRGLLTRAWLRFTTGVSIGSDTSQTDLDEAWEIAERGPMRLHMADIHLYRARLFHGVKPYPWTSPQEDLAAARKLIEQCGYWRRKEELEDAEAAAKNW